MLVSYNINNINKRILLERLWKKSKYNLNLINQTNPPMFSIDDAIKSIKSNGYIDYICGKPIKVYIKNNNISSSEYDTINGENSLLNIIKILKNIE